MRILRSWGASSSGDSLLLGILGDVPFRSASYYFLYNLIYSLFSSKIVSIFLKKCNQTSKCILLMFYAHPCSPPCSSLLSSMLILALLHAHPCSPPCSSLLPSMLILTPFHAHPCSPPCSSLLPSVLILAPLHAHPCSPPCSSLLPFMLILTSLYDKHYPPT